MGLTPHPVDVAGATVLLSMTWRKEWILSVAQCAHSAYEFCTSWQRRVEERKKGCEGERYKKRGERMHATALWLPLHCPKVGESKTWKGQK